MQTPDEDTVTRFFDAAHNSGNGRRPVMAFRIKAFRIMAFGAVKFLGTVLFGTRMFRAMALIAKRRLVAEGGLTGEGGFAVFAARICTAFKRACTVLRFRVIKPL